MSKFFLNGIQGFASINLKNNANLFGIKTKLVLLVSIIAIMIGTGGISNFTVYKYSLAQTANNVNFERTNIFGEQISVDLPQGWGMNDNRDGSVTICNATTTCKTASERVVITPDNSQSIQSSVSNTIQAEQPRTTQLNGQQYTAQVVHIQFGGNSYTITFFYLPTVEQEFQPIMKRISSSFSGPVSNDNSLSSEALGIKAENDHSTYCTDMGIIGTMNVDPGHYYTVPGCNVKMYVP